MPNGTVTLTYLFTDLESSTQLWERHPSTMPAALARHDELLALAVGDHGGTVVKTTGDGLMAVFTSPQHAVEASLAAQRTLAAEVWEQEEPLRVRMGIHLGESTPRDGDYYGTDVNKAARVMSAGHGGQVLITETALRALPGTTEGAAVKELGSHRLKDLSGSESLFQITPVGLPDSFPALNTLDVLPNNLPNQPSLFVGRDDELLDLRSMLTDDTVRLVTLTGPGGTGKTRLALQAAADRVDWFADGVYFVDLSAQIEADTAYQAIARMVDLESKAEEPVESLIAGLASKSVLLVLDNFEQVTEAAAGVARILSECPRVRVLVTSRQPLRIRGERIYPVAPLPVPEMSGDLADIAQTAAVELFVARAGSLGTGFVLDRDNAVAVASICRRLDGLPLAIELATARLNIFSAQDLDRRLESRFDVLRSGATDLPERQRTLRSTIEWSVDLLSEADRQLFAVFGQFRGAYLEQVEAVVDDLGIARDPIDGLASLVDKSLVRREEDTEGAVRFRMLETLRAHALELLAADPAMEEATVAAHAAAYRRLATSQQDELAGARRHDVLARLTADIDNLRTSWAEAIAGSDRAALNELLDPLWTMHDAQGWYDGLIDLAEDMLEVLRRGEPGPQQVLEEVALQMSVARAIMAVRGYTPEVEQRFESALQLAEDGGSLPERFPVLRSLASIYFARTEHQKGAELGRRLVDLASADGDRSLLAEAHYILGANLVMLNDVDGGLAHLTQCIDLFEPAATTTERFRLGPSPGVVALTTSAFVRFFRCETDQATSLATRAVDVARQLEHPLSLAYAHYHVALLHLWRQDIAAVAEQTALLAELAESQDYALWRSLALVLGGICRIATGDAAGHAQMEQGVQIYLTLKTPPGFVSGLFMLRAMGNLMAGRIDEALAGLSESRNASLDDSLSPFNAMAHVSHGDMLMAQPPPDPDAARAEYQLGYDLAHGLGVLGPELEAAVRLVQLAEGTPDHAAALALLEGAYERVTEGFDEAKVRAARELLQG